MYIHTYVVNYLVNMSNLYMDALYVTARQKRKK